MRIHRMLVGAAVAAAALTSIATPATAARPSKPTTAQVRLDPAGRRILSIT